MEEGTARVSVDIWVSGSWYCPGCDTMNYCSAKVREGYLIYCRCCGTAYNISEVKG